MDKKTNKSPKLRDFICVVCGKKFQRKVSLSSIKNGRGKVCSQECKAKWYSVVLRKGRYKKCARCGKMFWVRPSEEKRNKKYCSYECFFPDGKGKSISSDGYYVYSTKKVHRFLMEKHIGRKLLPTEIVHHINFDRFDNRIENLRIMSRKAHSRLHLCIHDGLTNEQRRLKKDKKRRKEDKGCEKKEKEVATSS